MRACAKLTRDSCGRGGGSFHPSHLSTPQTGMYMASSLTVETSVILFYARAFHRSFWRFHPAPQGRLFLPLVGSPFRTCVRHCRPRYSNLHTDRHVYAPRIDHKMRSECWLALALAEAKKLARRHQLLLLECSYRPSFSSVIYFKNSNESLQSHLYPTCPFPRKASVYTKSF